MPLEKKDMTEGRVFVGKKGFHRGEWGGTQVTELI